MIIGFTGTQKGMTQRQKDALRQLFCWLPIFYMRHGDCLGADSEAHTIFEDVLPLRDIFIHRPLDEKNRAFRRGENVSFPTPSLPYLQRNKYIAGCVAGFKTDLLIAAPGEDTEQLRSGTWATVRYARRCGTPRIILLP